MYRGPRASSSFVVYGSAHCACIDQDAAHCVKGLKRTPSSAGKLQVLPVFLVLLSRQILTGEAPYNQCCIGFLLHCFGDETGCPILVKELDIVVKHFFDIVFASHCVGEFATFRAWETTNCMRFTLRAAR